MTECWVCGGNEPLKPAPLKCVLAIEGEGVCLDCCENLCLSPHLCPDLPRRQEYPKKGGEPG